MKRDAASVVTVDNFVKKIVGITITRELCDHTCMIITVIIMRTVLVIMKYEKIYENLESP